MSSYPVPFAIDRSRSPRLLLQNASTETLHWVRVEMAGRGLAAAPLTPRLPPGGVLEVGVHGSQLALDSRLIVRWRRPNGDEYLYGVAL